MAASRSAKFFKRFLGRRVGLGMDRARGEEGQPHTSTGKFRPVVGTFRSLKRRAARLRGPWLRGHGPARPQSRPIPEPEVKTFWLWYHPVQAVLHAGAAVVRPEIPQGQFADMPNPVFDDAVPLAIGPGGDQGGQFRLQGIGQKRRSAGAGPIPQALHAFGVVAHDPVAQRLPVHAGLPRRRLPAGAVQRHGDRQQASANTAVALATGQATQFLGTQISADLQGRHGGGRSRVRSNTGNHHRPQTATHSHTESEISGSGITGRSNHCRERGHGHLAGMPSATSWASTGPAGSSISTATASRSTSRPCA